MDRWTQAIPALESAHAIAFSMQLAARRPAREKIVVNLSGRGDKHVDFMTDKYGTHEGSDSPRVGD
jgi:tryptophan synthase beta subunit